MDNAMIRGWALCQPVSVLNRCWVDIFAAVTPGFLIMVITDAGWQMPTPASFARRCRHSHAGFRQTRHAAARNVAMPATRVLSISCRLPPCLAFSHFLFLPPPVTSSHSHSSPTNNWSAAWSTAMPFPSLPLPSSASGLVFLLLLLLFCHYCHFFSSTTLRYAATEDATHHQTAATRLSFQGLAFFRAASPSFHFSRRRRRRRRLVTPGNTPWLPPPPPPPLFSPPFCSFLLLQDAISPPPPACPLRRHTPPLIRHIQIRRRPLMSPGITTLVAAAVNIIELAKSMLPPPPAPLFIAAAAVDGYCCRLVLDCIFLFIRLRHVAVVQCHDVVIRLTSFFTFSFNFHARHW